MSYVVVRGLQDDLVQRALYTLTDGRKTLRPHHFLQEFDRITEAPSLAHLVEHDLESLPLKTRNDYLRDSVAFRVHNHLLDINYAIIGSWPPEMRLGDTLYLN